MSLSRLQQFYPDPGPGDGLAGSVRQPAACLANRQKLDAEVGVVRAIIPRGAPADQPPTDPAVGSAGNQRRCRVIPSVWAAQPELTLSIASRFDEPGRFPASAMKPYRGVGHRHPREDDSAGVTPGLCVNLPSTKKGEKEPKHDESGTTHGDVLPSEALGAEWVHTMLTERTPAGKQPRNVYLRPCLPERYARRFHRPTRQIVQELSAVADGTSSALMRRQVHAIQVGAVSVTAAAG